MRRVILNADDLGYDPAVTRGIVEAMRRGVVSSTTYMVNTPHSEEAAGQVDGLGVGLHLNVARWASLARPGHVFVEAEAPRLESAFVEAETHAQLTRLEQLLGRPATHLDVHKHLHRHPNVLQGVVAAARARGLAVRSPDDVVRQVLRSAGVKTNDTMLGDTGTTAYWTLDVFEQHLATLPTEGVVELMCHPGYAPTHVSSGYAQQREVELATFTSPRAVALLATYGVALTSFS